MTAIDLGADVAVSWDAGVEDLDVTLTVTLPDGTTDTPAVTPDTTTYAATVATTQAGRHLLSWAADGYAYTDVLDVWPADPRFIISVDEAITAIRVSAERVVGGAFPAPDRSDMRLFIAAATPVIEDIVGPVVTAEKVRKFNGGRNAVLITPNIDSVTSVVVDGTTLVAHRDYTVDEASGIVYAGTLPGSWFPPGLMNIVITYQVGSSSIAPNIRTATATLVKKMWQQLMQAQHGYLSDGAGEETVTTQSGYVVPLAVWQLCRPNRRVEGVG